MIKPYYSDYVRHAMSFYTRYPNTIQFNKLVDKINWYACHKIIKAYPEKERDILIYIYGSADTISDNVYAMANKYQIRQTLIWDMMNDFERKVAVERGLI